VPHPSAAEIAAVAVGGVIGTAARWGLDSAVPHTSSQFPLSTLVTNIVGTFLLAFLTAGLWTRSGVPAWVKAGVGPGVLGTYTTFSAVVLALVTIAEANSPGLAVLYFVVTLVAGLAAAIAGMEIGRRLTPSGTPPTSSPSPGPAPAPTPRNPR
jgi:CrcB protein